MLKTTLLAAAALVAFGATAAYAGHDDGRYRGGKHGGYEYNYKPRPHAGHRRHHPGRYGARH